MTDEGKEAHRPIASLIRKSEKARRKLAPGTWQHSMLGDNLKALNMASAMMGGEANATDGLTQDDFHEAIRAFAVMMDRTGKALEKFPAGSSQHSLLRNRLAALRMAEALVKAALDDAVA